MLILSCTHNFKSARLEIFADNKPLLDASLEGKRRSLGLGYKGNLETATPVSAGQRWIRVHVSAAADKFDQSAQIHGAFAENRSRKLVIEFGKGSGLGMAAGKLTLSWKQPHLPTALRSRQSAAPFSAEVQCAHLIAAGEPPRGSRGMAWWWGPRQGPAWAG